MFISGWHIWCIFFLRLAACGLDISENGSDEVICSQGLSDCTMRNVLPLPVTDDNTVDVQNLKPCFKLCCQDTAPCALCLAIDTEVNIHLEKEVQDEHHSAQDEEDYNEETRIPKESVTICYSAVNALPVCKRVEFTVNPSVAQRQHAKISLVITRPSGISFSSHVNVYLQHSLKNITAITAPSLDEVCSQMPEERVEQCRVPRLISVINREMNRVDLKSSWSNKSLLSMCVQHEHNGRCQRWNRTTVPLYSVTPCMCFQVWYEEDQRSRRSLNCPFNNTDFPQSNVWLNVSVSLARGQMNDFGSLLWWNLSAPCRLEGEVWFCQSEVNCRGRRGPRQQLKNGTWRQDSKGQWVRIGMFEDVDPQLSPCVMVQVQGMGDVLGPFCLNKTAADRWRWSLLIVGLMLLVSMTVLIFYLLHDSVKKWAWSWRYGGFVKIGGKHHVVLLSPPDADDGVSESVCKLGSLLSAKGFSVSVDQWSREKQCTLGPMLWLHSQLLELKNQGGGRVVLVLTHKALERAEEWTRWHKEAVRTKGEDRGLSQLESPYSDAFMACLCLIQGDKQMGKAGERFVLVKFDSNPSNDKTLPELFQGLLLFHLPSQTHTLLTELTVSETGRGSRRRPWTGLKWSASQGLRSKKAEEAKLQNVLLC